MIGILQPTLVSFAGRGVRNPNSQLLYIIPKNEGSDAFRIDEKSGVIETRKSLDREEKAHYTFTGTSIS